MRFIKIIFFIFLPALTFLYALYLPEVLEEIAPLYLLYGYDIGIDEIILVELYASTIAYIVMFIIKKFENILILPVSFALTLVSAYIYEYFNPSWFSIGPYLAGMFYTLPFTVITAIAAIAIKIRDARKKRDCSLSPPI